MSNSTTNLDLINVSQAQKEVTANDLFNAASPAMLYGRQARTSGGLVWGYYGGAISVSGTPTAIANGTLTLTAAATNYLEADPATGTVSKNTSGWTAGLTPLYSVVCGTSTVTSYTDYRTGGGGGAITSVNGQTGEVVLRAADVGAEAAGAANAAVTTHAAASDPHPQYLTATEGNAAYDSAGAAAAAVAAHAAASDPHPSYLTQAEADALYAPDGSASVAAHIAEADPHTQYQKESEKGAANGYASLGGDGKVPSAQLPANVPQPFDMTAFYPGKPGASAVVLRVPVARAITFASGFSGSFGLASAAATASATFTIQRNGTSVGTAVFAAGAKTAVFAGSAFTTAAGDVLSIVAPSTQDASLSDPGFVLTGTR